MFRDIYEWLIKEKKVDSSAIKNLREYERKHNCTPYTAIEKLEICSLEDIKAGISATYQINAFNGNLSDYITATDIPEDVMREHNFAAVVHQKKDPATSPTYILIFDPRNNLPAIDAVKKSGFRGKISVKWITEEVYEYWKRLTNKSFNNSAFAKLSQSIETVDAMSDENDLDDESSIDAGSEDQKIVDLVNNTISRAIELGASDIHIESIGTGARIRYRIDGVLNLFNVLNDKSTVRRLINRLKVIGRMDVNNSRTPQSGKIRFEGHDVRVSTLPAVEGEKVVLRILNARTGYIRNLKELGYKEAAENLLRKMFTRPYGIILISGPTGSGKSSTLAAILDELCTDDVCMVTIEDPVEYRISGATQVNINPAAGLTFAGVLRETLRQDPNIIMVGEIRDKETAEISMQASNTGHLVLSTIHTNSAVSAITRLNDMGIDGYLVVDNIVGIVSQSLLRKLCPHCKKKHIIDENDIQKYYADPSLIGEESYIPGDGCSVCNGTGFLGRTVAYEILELTPLIKEEIHERKSADEIEAIAKNQNFIKKLDYAYQLVKDGTTSLQEVSRVIGGVNSEKADH